MSEITAHRALGAVSLNVLDLDTMQRFYAEILGFSVLENQAGRVSLGAPSGEALLHLFHTPGAPRLPRAAGLYHIALRVPDRLELARMLVRLAETSQPLQGVADHGVSEALYLADPEGNGLEIYRDYPEEDWPVDDKGRLVMDTWELDLDGLLAELGPQPLAFHGIHPETRVGHVHLAVNALEPEVAFFQRLLGLNLVTRYGPAAAFLAFGEYHHHIGVNTWQTAGGPPNDPARAGLRAIRLRYPDPAAREAALARLKEAGQDVQAGEAGWLARSPSGIAVLLEG